MTVNNRSSSCVVSHQCAANTRNVVSSNLSNRLHLGIVWVGVVVAENVVVASRIQNPNNDEATAIEEQSRLVMHAMSGGPPHDAT